MAITTIDYTKLSFDDVFCSKRGSKVARLNSGGDPCILMLKQHLRSPFDASTFDKDPAATRLNLQISLDDPIVVEQLQAFEAWLLDYLAQHSERIFKKVLTSNLSIPDKFARDDFSCEPCHPEKAQWGAKFIEGIEPRT